MDLHSDAIYKAFHDSALLPLPVLLPGVTNNGNILGLI